MASLETGTIRDRGAMDDKDMQLAKVVELFTKFSKDGWRLSEGAVLPCFLCCPGGLGNSFGHSAQSLGACNFPKALQSRENWKI